MENLSGCNFGQQAATRITAGVGREVKGVTISFSLERHQMLITRNKPACSSVGAVDVGGDGVGISFMIGLVWKLILLLLLLL